MTGIDAAEAPEQATVLVVDDTPANLRLLEVYLQSAGHHVLTALDGAAALRLLPGHAVDLVLADVMMPDMDGHELCRAIKQAPSTREVPVVLVTAGDDQAERERALAVGADDFVVKPVEKGMMLALVNALLRAKRLRRSLERMEGLVVSLAQALDHKDSSTAGLSERVAHWSMQLGAAIGLPEEDLTNLYKAGMVHDVGRLGVPQTILAKRGRLDAAEFAQVKRHVEIGEELLAPLPAADRLLPAVRHHHEWVDGSGYPDGLAGDRIPLYARIVAIADAFAALTNDRPYRSRVSRPEAIRTLREGAGTQWDASLVGRFVALLEDAEGVRSRAIGSAG